MNGCLVLMPFIWRAGFVDGNLESRVCWQQWSFVRRRVEEWCVVENLFALPFKNVRRLEAEVENTN